MMLCFMLATTIFAQEMPQDHWYPADYWDLTDMLPGEGPFDLVGADRLAIAPDGDLYLLKRKTALYRISPAGTVETNVNVSKTEELAVGGSNVLASYSEDYPNRRLRVRRRDTLATTATWIVGSMGDIIVKPRPLAVDADGLIYFACMSKTPASDMRGVTVWDADGTFLRSWDRDGDNLESVLTEPRTLTFGPNGLLHIATANDLGGGRVKVYTKAGEYVESLPFFDTAAISADGLIHGPAHYNGRWYMYNYTRAGVQVAKSLLCVPSETVAVTGECGGNMVFDPWGRMLCTLQLSGEPYGIAVYERAYRTQLGITTNRPPAPGVQALSQRPGTTLIDVDYSVSDPDSTNLTTAALAFQNGTLDLDHLVLMRTFVEGSSTNLGTGKQPSTTYRITWDAGSDTTTNVMDVGVNILAMDDRELLGFHFISVPGLVSNTTLTISRSPVTETEMMPAFYWLLATGDASVAFANGQITGVGGLYDGDVLAQSSDVTDEGRAFLFQRLGVRDATPQEVLHAKEAEHPGLVNQFAPRVRVGHHPKQINEYSMDTGTWSADSYFVVPLP